REGYYKGNNDDNTAEVIVAKNRNGENGNFQLMFDRKIQKFTDLEIKENSISRIRL
ncbi:MAG: hypothetical protein JHC31_09090, partial [Sulfurihydrogenibium sp.]|nr:hypothetical protein [Sulfurihydrogenibium sp.]